MTITSVDAASLAALRTISRDTAAAGSTLTRQFTDARRTEIAQGFAATRQLVTEITTFFANRAAEQMEAEDLAIASGDVTSDGKKVVLVDGERFVEVVTVTNGVRSVTLQPLPARSVLLGNSEAARNELGRAASIRSTYGAGEGVNFRLLATALTAAAGGNVTGSVSSLARGVAVNVVQNLAVSEIKDIADSFGARDNAGELRIGTNGQIVPTRESEAVRTLLQGIAGCAGAAAQNASCASGALGASSSVLLNLLADLAERESNSSSTGSSTRSLASQQARTALIATLSGALAGAFGADVGTAVGAAINETQNNALRTRDGRLVVVSLNKVPFSILDLRNDPKLKLQLDNARRIDPLTGKPETDEVLEARYVKYVNDLAAPVGRGQPVVVSDPSLDRLGEAFGDAAASAQRSTTCQADVCVSNVGPPPSVNQILAAAEKNPELARVLKLIGNADQGSNAALLAGFIAGNTHSGDFKPTSDEARLIALIVADQLYLQGPASPEDGNRYGFNVALASQLAGTGGNAAELAAKTKWADEAKALKLDRFAKGASGVSSVLKYVELREEGYSSKAATAGVVAALATEQALTIGGAAAGGAIGGRVPVVGRPIGAGAGYVGGLAVDFFTEASDKAATAAAEAIDNPKPPVAPPPVRPCRAITSAGGCY